MLVLQYQSIMMPGAKVMEQTINAVQARQQLGRLLDEVYYRRHSVVIERSGRPTAVLVPVERYRQWMDERGAFFAQIDKLRARTAGVTSADLEAEVAEAVSAVRRGDA